MSRLLTATVIGLILVGGLIAAIRYLPDDFLPIPKDEALDAPPKPAEPVDLSPEEARQLFAARSSVTTTPGTADSATSGYLTLSASLSPAFDLAPLLLEVFDQKVGSVVLSASVRTSDGRSLPAIPILVLARMASDAPAADTSAEQAAAKQAGAPPPPPKPRFTDAFTAGEGEIPLTPLLSADQTGQATVSLSAHYFESDDIVFLGGLTGEVESLVSTYASDPAPLLIHDTDTAAHALADRMAGKKTKHVGEILSTEIPLADGAGAVITFRNPAGEDVGSATVRVSSHAPRLANASTGPLDFAANAAVPLGQGQTLGTLLANQGEAVAGVLSAEKTALPEACTTLRQRLASAGLGAYDRAATLAFVAALRDRFAPTKETSAPCLDKTEEGLLGTPSDPAVSAPVSLSLRNGVLKQIGGLLRFGATEQGLLHLAKRFSDHVVLFDRSQLWLPGIGGNAIEGTALVVAPQATSTEAAELVATLPAAHVACYFNPGTGRGESHRAALVELQHDPGLWVLDAAFDGQGKITGLALEPADQARACRAAGKRTSGADACYFVRTGRTYRGINPGKC